MYILTKEMYIISVAVVGEKLAQKSISEDILKGKELIFNRTLNSNKNFDRSRSTTALPNTGIIRNHDSLVT